MRPRNLCNAVGEYSRHRPQTSYKGQSTLLTSESRQGGEVASKPLWLTSYNKITVEQGPQHRATYIATRVSTLGTSSQHLHTQQLPRALIREGFSLRELPLQLPLQHRALRRDCSWRHQEHPNTEATSQDSTSETSGHLAWPWPHHEWAHPCTTSSLQSTAIYNYWCLPVRKDHSCTSRRTNWRQVPGEHLLATAQWWHRLQHQRAPQQSPEAEYRYKRSTTATTSGWGGHWATSGCSTSNFPTSSSSSCAHLKNNNLKCYNHLQDYLNHLKHYNLDHL